MKEIYMKKISLLFLVFTLTSVTGHAGLIGEETGNRIAETGTGIAHLVAVFALLALVVVGVFKLVQYFRELGDSMTRVQKDIAEMKDVLMKQDDEEGI